MLAKLENKCKDFFNKYNVADLCYPSSEIIFILESPHKQEVKYGYPVAGSSGLEMSKFIYGAQINQPFGKLLNQVKKNQALTPGLEKFAVVNTSCVPLQASDLQNFELNESESKIMSILEKLRANYQSKTHRKKSWNIIKQELINNFKYRLKQAIKTTNSKYIIPCGKFATTYLDLIAEQDLIGQNKVLTGIPHPAFNQWSYFDEMSKLEEIIKRL